MEKTIIERMGNLLSVKSLVTLTLTGVFAYMSVAGAISQDFMTVYAVVIAFYFGSQSQKARDAAEGAGTPAEARRGGSGGERTNSGLSAPSAAADGEGHGAGEDDGNG